VRDIEATIPIDRIVLSGTLSLPEEPCGLVVFAHGSGSSRFSPRNRHVADLFQKRGLATLLIDLLTKEEDEIDRVTRHLRFDIALLAGRLAEVGSWAAGWEPSGVHRIAYFGASTGAAAALIAAARDPERVASVVSRGGRPDLAMHDLANVLAPTLLIVGERDYEVLALNQKALLHLPLGSRLEIVPNATHLFEEEGALDAVAQLAGDWFVAGFARTKAV
jgi:pimeloyl-ACP methyl ester carboxylesterase